MALKLGCILALLVFVAHPAVAETWSAVDAAPDARIVQRAPAGKGTGWLYVVVDGLNGHAGVDTATTLAQETIENRLKEAKVSTTILKSAFAAANSAIVANAKADARLKGMGATAAALWIDGGKAYVAHVGDVRVYLFRGGKLTQLTKDHSLLNDYLKTHKLTPEEIAEFPMQNVVVRAIGMKDSLEVEVATHRTRSKDLWLVASGGLHKRLDDAQLTTILAGSKGYPSVATEALTDAANKATSTTSTKPAFVVIAVP